MISEYAAAYENVWILGDCFVYDSTAFLHRYLKIRREAHEIAGSKSYISDHYCTEIFASSSTTSLVRSSLGRLRNQFANALNKYDLLLKYIILAIENDILRCVNFKKPGLSEIFGQNIQWLADKMHSMIADRKADLMKRAKKFNYPLIFWVELPEHEKFQMQTSRGKFNQTMEKVIPLY